MLLFFSSPPPRLPDISGLPGSDGCAGSAALFFCPSKWQLWQQVLALLPRGRAWQTHEPPVYTINEAGVPDIDSLTVQQRYWAAYAEVLEYLHQRACALLDEMYCASARELLPEWLTEYGFPDQCEPYDTLCEKVADLPGASCTDIAVSALRRGWVIECVDCGMGPYAPPVAEFAIADQSPADCGCIGLTIRVLTAQSPAYTAETLYPVADQAVADCSDLCGPRVAPLICLIERIRPAHIPVTYEVIT